MHYPSAFLSLEQFDDHRPEMIEFLTNPNLAEEFPDAGEDLAKMVSTESYIKQLMDLDDRIKSSRGMSRGMALELKELVPDLQSFSPMNYTNDVSGIMYQVSLEEISVAIWGVIAAAVALVLGLIYKFINWMTGGSSGGGGGGGGGSSSSSIAASQAGLHETAANVKEQAKIVHQANNNVKAMPKTTHVVSVPAKQSHSAVKNSHMPNAVKQSVISSTKDTNGHVVPDSAAVDIEVQVMKELEEINKGGTNPSKLVPELSYSKLLFDTDKEALDVVEKSFDIFAGVAEDIITKVENLQAAFKEVEESSDPHKDVKKAQELAKAPSKAFATSGIKFVDENVRNATEWKMKVQSVFDWSRNAKIEEDFMTVLDKFDKGYERVSNVDWVKMDNLYKAIIMAESALEMSHEKMTAWAKEDSPHRHSAYWTMVIKHITQDVQRDLSAVMAVYSKLAAFYQDCSKDALTLLENYLAYLKRFRAFFHKYEKPVPEDVQGGIDIFEGLIKDMKASPVYARFLSKKHWLDISKK